MNGHDANHFRLRHELGDVSHHGVRRGASQAGRRLVQEKHLRFCSVERARALDTSDSFTRLRHPTPLVDVQQQILSFFLSSPDTTSSSSSTSPRIMASKAFVRANPTNKRFCVPVLEQSIPVELSDYWFLA